MKMTIDIPDLELKEVVKHAGAKTRREAILTAVREFNKWARLDALSEADFQKAKDKLIGSNDGRKIGFK